MRCSGFAKPHGRDSGFARGRPSALAYAFPSHTEHSNRRVMARGAGECVGVMECVFAVVSALNHLANHRRHGNPTAPQSGQQHDISHLPQSGLCPGFAEGHSMSSGRTEVRHMASCSQMPVKISRCTRGLSPKLRRHRTVDWLVCMPKPVS